MDTRTVNNTATTATILIDTKASDNQLLADKKLSPEEQKRMDLQLWEGLDDPVRVKTALEQGANPCYIRPEGYWQGWSALAYTVYSIDFKSIRSLYQRSLIIESFLGRMPLEAIQQRFPENADHHKGWTLLSYLIAKHDVLKVTQRGIFDDGMIQVVLDVMGHVIGDKGKHIGLYNEKTKYLIWLFLEKGDDSNQLTLDGRPVLLLTVEHDNPLVAELLLSYGANPKHQIHAGEYQGWSFIEVAMEMDWPQVVFLAVKNGINLEETIAHGHFRNQKIREYLEARGYRKQLNALKTKTTVSNNIQPTLDNKYITTPSLTAPPTDIKLMLENQPANALPKFSHATLLFKAADEKSLTQFRHLKEQEKADFHITDEKTGDTLLHRTTAVGADADVLEYLINKNNCGVNARNNKQETPLYQAVTNGHVETSILLVNVHGASLDIAYGEEKISILEVALRKRLPVQLIMTLSSIKSTENINQAFNGNRFPALHLAAQAGHTLAVEYFIKEKKADANIKHGSTPLQFAAQNQHTETMTTLLKNGSHFNGESKEDKALLESKDTPIAVKNALENHLALQKLQKKEQEGQITALTNAIFVALFKDRASNPKETSIVEQLIQPVLKTIPSLSTVKDEKEFGRLVKYHFLKNSELASKKPIADWYDALAKKEKHREQFKKDLKKSINAYVEKTHHERIVTDIANEIINNDSIKKKPIDLLKWIKDILSKDVRLKDITINTSDLQNVIIQELRVSINEDVKDMEEIYQLRIKSAIENYLFKNKFLSENETISYNISEQLTKKLQKECKEVYKDNSGMKPKKEGIARYLIKQVFDSYPANESIAVFLKQNPTKVTHFIRILFTQLKNEEMAKFSVKTDGHHSYQNKLRTHIDTWLISNKTPGSPFFQSHSHKMTDIKLHDNDGMQAEFEFTRAQTDFTELFCSKFDEFYSTLKALNLKTVKRPDSSVDHAAKKVEENKNVFPSFTWNGLEIPTGSIAVFFSQIAVYLKNESVMKSAERMTSLFRGYTLTDRANIIEFAAKSITYRYQHQIDNLTVEGISALASCAVYRIVEYITRNDENSEAKNPGIFEKAGANFSDYIYGRRQSPQLIKKLESPIKVFMNGVVEGRSEKDSEHLGTRLKLQWLPSHIFNNTGVIVRDENNQLRLYTHGRLHKNPDGSPEYGFCYGTLAEVTANGYTLDDKTPLEVALSMATTNGFSYPKLTNSMLMHTINAPPVAQPVNSSATSQTTTNTMVKK